MKRNGDMRGEIEKRERVERMKEGEEERRKIGDKTG